VVGASTGRPAFEGAKTARRSPEGEDGPAAAKLSAENLGEGGRHQAVSAGQQPMTIAFRPATPQDFDYCASLYFAGMEAIIRQLDLDMAAHTASFRARWDVAEVRILTRDGADIGWLQTATEADAVFLKQLFVEAPHRRLGIGTEVMRRLVDEAANAGRAVTLGVVKTNPAKRLYDRLGFRVTHDDGRKFYMRRDSSP
jgi:GNAT superfamily N-acetyltransferase